jgi:hypothetical protein
MDMLDGDIREIATTAIGVGIGVFIGLMLFAWEIGLKKAVRAWLEDRAEVRMALHTIERYEERQRDPEYQRPSDALGEPEWDEIERADVARAHRTLKALR